MCTQKFSQNFNTNRDSIFGIHISHVVWDILHGKIRIGNKLIRIMFREVMSNGVATSRVKSADALTKLIRKSQSGFDIYRNKNGNSIQPRNLRGKMF